MKPYKDKKLQKQKIKKEKVKFIFFSLFTLLLFISSVFFILQQEPKTTLLAAGINQCGGCVTSGTCKNTSGIPGNQPYCIDPNYTCSGSTPTFSIHKCVNSQWVNSSQVGWTAENCFPTNPCAGATSTPPPTNPITIALRSHLKGIGTGINQDGTPENTNPTQKIMEVSLSILSTSSLTASTATQNQPQPTTATGRLTYNANTGLFENPQFVLPNTIYSGKYKFILHIDKYLDRQITLDTNSPIIELLPGINPALAVIAMTPGDVTPQTKGDNIVDIQDFNTMVGCLNNPNTAICPNPQIADLNGDAIVDKKDLQLLIDYFGGLGDSFTIQQFICTQDPFCTSGNNTMQLCPLQCKMQKTVTP